MTLPMEYQTVGVSIGDVGIVKDNGGFDFLFNIHEPVKGPQHFINPRTLPTKFTPLEKTDDLNITDRIIGDNNFLATSLEDACYNKETLYVML